MGSKKKNGNSTSADLKSRVTKGRALLAQLRALFPEAQEMPQDDRQRSQGRFGLEESEGMRGVVDAMEAEPAVFASLADRDGGNDPKRLETELLRDRLDQHDAYLELAADTESFARALNDRALEIGALVAPPLRAGYEIAKPVSKNNPVIRRKIAKMLDYHGGNAAAAAAARKANRSSKKPATA
jgi:hypothetical protein